MIKLLVISCFMVVMLGSCSQRFERYSRYNKAYNMLKSNDTLVCDVYIYCGVTRALGEPIFESNVYKDTIMNMLFSSLKKDSMIQVKEPLLAEGINCYTRPKRHFRYVIDSVIGNIQVKEKKLIPIVFYSKIEQVNTSNAMQGHVSFSKESMLIVLFCIKGQKGVEYVNGQLFWWINGEMHQRYLQQEHLDRLLARGLRKYKKAIRKSKQ